MRPPAIPHRLRTWLLLLPGLPIILWAVVVVLTVVQGNELERTFDRFTQQNTALYRDIHQMYSMLTEQHLAMSSPVEQIEEELWWDSSELFHKKLSEQLALLSHVIAEIEKKNEQVGFPREIQEQHKSLLRALAEYQSLLIKVEDEGTQELSKASNYMVSAGIIFIEVNQQFSSFLAQLGVSAEEKFNLLKQSTADKNKTIATTATIIALMVLAVSVALYQRLSGGFQQMLRVARTIQGRGYRQEDYCFSKDEMGYLAKRIYEMGLALDDMRQNLEDRVNKRTAELQKVTTNLENEVEKTHAMAEQLRYLAETDELTGLNNRRYFVEQMDKEWKRAVRHNRSLALLIIDVDFFKQVNDRYGHQMGDQCLRVIAATLKLQIRRSSDLVARLGGEEFAVLIPETEFKEACSRAEQLLEQVEQIELPPVTLDRKLTISIGIGQLEPSYKSVNDFINAVDKALYVAKENGRNRFAIASCSDKDSNQQPSLF
jgi:diguanylate cyclase (GGDEF)-like protein